ncbi:unnamed protein product, partial [marine sediment metagenome]
ASNMYTGATAPEHIILIILKFDGYWSRLTPARSAPA